MSRQSTGEFLATLRKANGFTQAEVAEKLNISNRTLSSWETDRTMPDVLILTALADLYGVTVDEILRGERAQGGTADKKPDLTEKSARNIRKRKFGVFSSKCSLLTGTGCGSACLIVLTCALFLFTNSPFILDLIVGILSGIGILTSLILIFYFYNSVKQSEGIVLPDDYSDENKLFLNALRRKITNALGIISLPFLTGFILFLIAFLIVMPESNVYVGGLYLNFQTPYFVVIFANLALFLAFYITYALLAKSIENEKQAEIRKQNRKLLIKVCGFGIIPLAVVFAVFLVLLCLPNVITELHSAENLSEFKKTFQTLTVNEDSQLHTELGCPVGEYYLDFPDNCNYHTKYDLGNGFTGYKQYYSGTDYWQISYNDSLIVTPYKYISYDIGENSSVVDVAYHYDDMAYDAKKSVFTTKISYGAYYDDGKYSFAVYDIRNYAPLAYGLLLSTVGVTLIVLPVVYFTKRKKIKYDYNF